MTIKPGTNLGHYSILSKIGAGGMGEVYLAQDTKLDRRVALKILPAEVAANRDRMDRFVREAKSAAALNHPSIAHIYEIGESDGTNFIAMEFVDGSTLREKIHQEKTELNSLKLKLAGESEQKLARRYTSNDEAYQLYLKGRFHFAKRTRVDILKGIEYFQQAIQLDPNFALAYAAIAESNNSLGKNADLPPREVSPRAKAASIRALEIDPTLAEAHAALADTLAIFDWNWAESEREFEKALQLDSNLSYTHLTHGASYLVPLGKADEAVTELRRAIELEPLSLITNAICGQSYLYARQNNKALAQGRKTYDLDPNFRFGRQYLGNAYIVLGRYDEATALAEEGLKTFPMAQEYLVIAGLAHAKAGRRREAEQYLDRFTELAKTRYVRTSYVASIYAALGDKDKAFAALEKSFADKDYFLPRIQLDPFMESLRDDPRFKDLLKRMGLAGESAGK